MRGPAPPKWAEKFFRWYCRNQLAESILGDLEEEFYYNLEKKGLYRARLIYWLNTFRFINKYTLRKDQNGIKKIGGANFMLFHHLLISVRNLVRHKTYTAINIGGLATGLASCLLIASFLSHELSFDKFHEDSENIYRINHFFVDNSGTVTKMANTAPALIPEIRHLFPEIKKATRMRFTRRVEMSSGERRFYENRGFFADSSFFEVFTFPLESGDKFTALDNPNSVVITGEMALKYFGDRDPMGQMINLNGEVNLEVTGVLKPIPANSHLQFDFIISFPTYRVPADYLSDLTSWSWTGFMSYVRLEQGSDHQSLEDKINAIYADMTPEGSYPDRTYVQPLEDIYLYSGDLSDDLASGLQAGNSFTLISLGTVALLILIIAGFNFMNLYVAVSATRYKEAGLRKMLGAERSSLISQLLTESVLVSFISLTLAYLIGWGIFSYLKDLLEWNFSPGWSGVLTSLPYAIAVTSLVGICSGIYPAIFLSGHKVVAALKNSVKNSAATGSGLRRILTAAQFCISIALIAATIVITQQYSFLSGKELGYDKENIVILKLPADDMRRYYEPFREQLLQNNHVVNVSRTQRTMGEPWPVNMILAEGKDATETKRILGSQVGYEFLETMGIKVAEGRTFSREFGSDNQKSVILNRKAAEYLELENPLGKEVNYFAFDGPRKIIGIVEDFNFLSLHHEITPMALVLPFVDVRNIIVKVTPGSMTEKIGAITETWDKINPGLPLEYRFMDEYLNRLYLTEQRLSGLIFGFSLLTILLACTGLYGLIAFSLNQRRKEMGIRKVLGARVSSLLIRFTRQYVYLIGAASLIAIPAVQYILTLWLEGFAYKVEISWWIYLVSVAALLVIALATISHQALSAAMVNPVNVLKDE